MCISGGQKSGSPDVLHTPFSAVIHEFSAGCACSRGRREEGQGGCVGSGTSSARGDEPFAPQPETASSPPRSHPEAGAAKASPPPPPSQGLTRLIGNEVGDRIKDAFSTRGCFVPWSCFPESTSILGPQRQALRPASLEQTKGQADTLSSSEKCDKMPSGMRLSRLTYLENFQAPQNTFKSNTVSSCF